MIYLWNYIKGAFMSLSTSNKYGNITISDDSIAIIVNKVAKECYGVSDLVSRRLSDSLLLLFKKEPLQKGVKLVTTQSRIYIDLYVILNAGVNREAVISSLRKTVIYHVENFSGMIVKAVNIHVVGSRL